MDGDEWGGRLGGEGELNTYIRNGAFGSIVPHQAWPGSRGTGGGDVDDGTTLALLEKLGDEGFGGVEDAFYIDVEDALEFFYCHFH